MKISDYQPCTEKPYIALCFEKTDHKRVLPVLKKLYQRGIRIWYCQGFEEDLIKEELRQQKMMDAGLILVVRSLASCESRFLKATALYYEDQGKELAFLDLDELSKSQLETGLKKEHAIVPSDSEELTDAIIHLDGFSQLLLGDPFVARSSKYKYATIGAILLALVVSGLIFLVGKGYICFASKQDTIHLVDKTMERGARYSISGSYQTPLTKEAVEELDMLYLDAKPKNISDLMKFHNLQTIVMKRCDEQTAKMLLPSGITLIVEGGK